MIYLNYPHPKQSLQMLKLISIINIVHETEISENNFLNHFLTSLDLILSFALFSFNKTFSNWWHHCQLVKL